MSEIQTTQKSEVRNALSFVQRKRLLEFVRKLLMVELKQEVISRKLFVSEVLSNFYTKNNTKLHKI